MGKKFIDKRRAATFQLLARDTGGPSQSNGLDSDHVFVRVDNNPVMIDGFGDGHENDSNSDDLADDPDSRFADAPEDEDFTVATPAWLSVGEPGPLPDHIRREILELGFPDDGYNYLKHMREIKNRGGGSMYYQNPNPNLDQIPYDVKAYDASKVVVEGTSAEVDENKIIYKVAEKTVKARVKKAVDPEVAALLDEVDSQCGSDIEDLEEDFVVKANLPGEGADSSDEEDCILVDESEEHTADEFPSFHASKNIVQARDYAGERKDINIHEEPRARRPLDEQFDMLELQEYGSDSDNDYGNFEDEEEEPLEKKLHNAFKHQKIAELALYDNYKTPADFVRGDDDKQNKELSGSAAVVLQRCVEYAEKYENGDEDEREVIVEESSDESEAWDCETIVTTYSNLDNHPARIGAPGIPRKKKLTETVSDVLKRNNNNVISLHGKDRIPMDYLPHAKSVSKEKVKVAVKPEQPKKRQEESKEEKKERKSAIKEEKREARRLKKETKELYKGEAKRAQKAASVCGPSSIRLM